MPVYYYYYYHRRRFWHATQDCLALHVDHILHQFGPYPMLQAV